MDISYGASATGIHVASGWNHRAKSHCLLALWLIIGLVLGSLPAVVNAGSASGAVMARSVVLDQSGQPILVEFNDDGSEGQPVSIPSDYQTRIRELRIYSAADYRTEVARYQQFKQAHQHDLAPADQDLMSVDRFMATTFKTADDKKEIAKPPLAATVKSVLTRNQPNRILADSTQLVLLSFVFDLTQAYDVDGNDVSLVVTPEGQIIAHSSKHIAYRTGFFGDPTQAADIYGTTSSRARAPDTPIFGPIPNVRVYSALWESQGGSATTDANGKYVLHYPSQSCLAAPDLANDLYAELYYQSFRPTGAAILPFFMRLQNWDACSGSASSPGYYPRDFKVDVIFLTGMVTIKNPDESPVACCDKTEYGIFDRANQNEPTAQAKYDFDGDGQYDTVVLGKGATPDTFVAAKTADEQKQATHQGVYFSSRTDKTGAPDLIRVADTEKNLTATGWLKSISRDDMQNTDILVFRESTGQLVVERIGLRDAEIDYRDQAKVDANNARFDYNIALRGPSDSSLNVGAITRRGTFEEIAERYRMAEPFRKREADHLKSGEWVRVIAINRATGYMASARVPITDASKNPGGMLSVNIPPLEMTPHNLMVWAEWYYSIANGATTGII